MHRTLSYILFTSLVLIVPRSAAPAVVSLQPSRAAQIRIALDHYILPGIAKVGAIGPVKKLKLSGFEDLIVFYRKLVQYLDDPQLMATSAGRVHSLLRLDVEGDALGAVIPEDVGAVLRADASRILDHFAGDAAITERLITRMNEFQLWSAANVPFALGRADRAGELATFEMFDVLLGIVETEKLHDLTTALRQSTAPAKAKLTLFIRADAFTGEDLDDLLAMASDEYAATVDHGSIDTMEEWFGWQNEYFAGVIDFVQHELKTGNGAMIETVERARARASSPTVVRFFSAIRSPDFGWYSRANWRALGFADPPRPRAARRLRTVAAECDEALRPTITKPSTEE